MRFHRDSYSSAQVSAQPLLEPETKVTISHAEVAEAVDDLRQMGVSLVQPVSAAVEHTKASGASVLQQGAEAAEQARLKAQALGRAGLNMAHSGAEMWQHGTEASKP